VSDVSANGSDLIGRGWAFPIASDDTGSIELVSGVGDVERAMYLILATSPGERPMRPEFGCRLQDFVFAPADATTAGLIAYEVRVALERWEPRIALEEVVVTADPDDTSTLWIDVRYSLRATYDRRNLVFPFYVIPEHDEGS
jgi:phage baseplate assembly protein W